MAGFFDRMLGRNKEPGSASRARERLQVVLVHDRINLPPERLQMMKQELVAVISKYVALTDSDVEIALEQRDRNQNWLRAEVPFAKPIDPDDPDEDAPYPLASALDLYFIGEDTAPEQTLEHEAYRPDTDIFITGDVNEGDLAVEAAVVLPFLADPSHSEETRPVHHHPLSDSDPLLQRDLSRDDD